MKAEKYNYDEFMFWVRNDQTFDDMDKYEKAKNLHYISRNCLVYDYKSNTIKFENCENEEKQHSFVCEYDWRTSY